MGDIPTLGYFSKILRGHPLSEALKICLIVFGLSCHSDGNPPSRCPFLVCEGLQDLFVNRIAAWYSGFDCTGVSIFTAQALSAQADNSRVKSKYGLCFAIDSSPQRGIQPSTEGSTKSVKLWSQKFVRMMRSYKPPFFHGLPEYINGLKILCTAFVISFVTEA